MRKENLKQLNSMKELGRRTLSGLLALLMFLGAIPSVVLESFATEQTYTEYDFAGGNGTVSDPYILSNGADFKGLADNVENIPLYSADKYFRVEKFDESGSTEIYLDGDYCIGGLGEDANYYFLGNLDLNGYQLTLSSPLFGTLGEGVEIYNGTLVITDNADTLPQWGTLARRIVASDAEEKTGVVSLRKIQVSTNVAFAAENDKKDSFGGLIGAIINTGSEDMSVKLEQVSVGPDVGENFRMTAIAQQMGGLVGTLHAGDTANVYLTMDGVSVEGIIRNEDKENGILGGLIGAATQGCEIDFTNTNTVPNPDELIGDYRALIIGAANQSLVYTRGSTEMVIDGELYGLNDLILQGEEMIDLANAGSVYGDLNLDDAVSGKGTAEEPYRITSNNEMLLLAAAINTEHSKVLECFGENVTREYLRHAVYKIINNLDLSDRGFTGIGYYADDENYQGFAGTIFGDTEFPPTIRLGLHTTQSHAAFVPVLEDGAKISNLIFTGSIETTNSYAGAVAGSIGKPSGSPGKISVTLEGIHSDVNIRGTTDKVAGFGGLVGHANYAKTTGKSELVLKETAFTGTVTAAGTYVGGLIGRIDTPSQKMKPSETFGLDVQISDYSFEGTLVGSNVSGSYFGGCIGSIVAPDKYSTAENTAYTPGSGFALQYNTLNLEARDIYLGGDIGCVGTGVGGFAATMSGVDGVFTDVSLAGDYRVENGFGGLAQMAAGRYTVNGVNVAPDGNWSIGMGTPNPSGILFGNSANAWVEVEEVNFNAPIPNVPTPTVPSQPANTTESVETGEPANTTEPAETGEPVNAAEPANTSEPSNAIEPGETDESANTGNTGIVTIVGTGDFGEKFADLSAYTFYISNNAYAGAEALVGGMVNVKDENYTPTAYNHADQSRIYDHFEAVLIGGSGTEADPFVIDSPNKLQTLSVFQYLAPNISWMLLDCFPNAAYGETWTDVDKVMYLKNACYRFEGDLDLTGMDYYPMPVIGGSYDGSTATVTFAKTEDSTDRLSSKRENHGGLFTAVTPASEIVPVVIKGFTLQGEVAGTYYPGALISGFLKPDDPTRIGVPAISGGLVEISGITLDGVRVSGGDYYTESKTNGTGLLVGEIEQGSHTITDIEINLPQEYVEDEHLADALIGRAFGDKLLLETERIAFPEIDSWPTAYFALATFIGRFDSGIGYYYYNSREDDDSYAYDISSGDLRKQGAESKAEIIVNPESTALDRGYGRADAPYIIDSPAQLYALATVLNTDGRTLGSVLSGVNGKNINNLSTAEQKLLAEELSKAYYRIIEDLDFSRTKLGEDYNNSNLDHIGLGSLTMPFSGTMDGRGHRIVLSSEDADGAVSNFGLFRFIKGANIQNMHITTYYKDAMGEIEEDVLHVKGGADESYNGMVAAVALGGDNMLDNIKVSGEISVTDSGNSVYVGGYIGRIEAGTVHLINLPENYVSELSITVNNEPVAAGNDRYAAITPYVQDGYVIYRGDDPSTSIVLEEQNVIEGKVNQYISVDIGVEYGHGLRNYKYSLVEDGMHKLPASLGLTLAEDGTLSGTLQYGGIFPFVILATAERSVDGREDVTETIYEVKTYTLMVEKDIYPTLDIDHELLSGLTYATEKIDDLAVANFPYPGNDKARSDANLIYQIEEGNEVVRLSADGSGLEIIGIGHVKLTVTKPEDSAYYMTSRTLEFDVRPADIWVTVEDVTHYYGTVFDEPENFAVPFVEGLRGFTDGKYPYPEVKMAWEQLGLAPLEVTPDSGLNLEKFEENKVGDYTLTINPVDVPEEVLSKYHIRYRNGLVHIEKKRVTVDDYVISMYNAEGEEVAVEKKFNGAWYNGRGIVVRPTGDYNLISMDGETWLDKLEFIGQQDRVVQIWLKDDRENGTGIITDKYPLQVRIDWTAPEAAIKYITSGENSGPIFTSAFSNHETAVFENLSIRISGQDPLNQDTTYGSSASGILRVEYLLLKEEQEKGTWMDAVEAAKPSDWVAISGSLKEELLQNDMQGAYFVRAIDQAGNVSPVVYWEYPADQGNAPWFILDTAAPVIEVLNSAEFGSWFVYEAGIPDLSFKVTDAGTGVASVSYTIDGVQTGVDEFNGIRSIRLSDLSDGVHTVQITATDKAGHTDSTTVTVKRESNQPQITITPDWNDATGYTQYKRFTVSVPAGLSDVFAVWVLDEENNKYLLEKTGVNENEYSFTARKSGDITYTVRVEKEAVYRNGEKLWNESQILVPKIDNTKPVLTIDSLYNHVWTDREVMLDLIAGGDYKGTATLHGYFESRATADLIDAAVEKGSPYSYSVNAESGSYINGTYYFYLVSESGVESDHVPYEIKIDRVKPEFSDIKVNNAAISGTLNQLTFGWFFNSIVVTATVVESHSGLKETAIVMEESNSTNVLSFPGTYSETSPGDYHVTFVVTDILEFEGSIKLTAQDIVGNYKELSLPEEVILDGRKPALFEMKFDSVTTERLAAGLWSTENMTVFLSGINDAGGSHASGIGRIVWWFSKTAVEPNGLVLPNTVNELFAFDGSNSASENYEIPIADTPDGDQYLAVAVFDKAGNYRVVCKQIKKDSEKAQIVSLSAGNVEKLERDQAGNYTVKTDYFIKTGEQIRVTVSKQAPYSPLTLKVVQIGKDGAEQIFWVPVNSAYDGGTCSVTFTMPAEIAKLPGTYTFTVYHGNYGQQSDPNIVADYQSNSVSLMVDKVDNSTPNKPEISNADAFANWLVNLPDISVHYAQTTGASEWLEYAALSGLQTAEQFVGEYFYTLTDQDPWTGSGTANGSLSDAELKKNGLWTLAFRVRDEAGNASEIEILRIRKDDIVPVLEVVTTGPVNGEWTNQEVSFTLTNAGKNPSPCITTVTIGDQETELKANQDSTFTYELDGKSLTAQWDADTSTLKVFGDCAENTSVRFGITSGAGLSDSSATYYVSLKRSNTVPALSVEDLDADIDPANGNWNEAWYNKKSQYPTILLKNNRTALHPEEEIYYLCWTVDGVAGDKLELPANGVALPFHTLTGDGRFEMEVWLEDEAGNRGKSVAVTVRADRTSPADVNLSKVRINGNETVLAVSVEDAESGAGSCSYYYDENGGSFKPGEDSASWKPCTNNQLTVPTNYRGTIYIRVSDLAGNVEIFERDSKMFETYAPKIEGSILTELVMGADWYAEHPAFNIRVEEQEADWYSGLSSVTVEEIQNGKTLVTKELQVDRGVYVHEDVYTTESEGVFTVRVTAVDLAGNVTVYSFDEVKVDSSSPSLLSVTMTTEEDGKDYSGDWTNQSVIITLETKDYKAQASYSYSLDGGTTWVKLPGNRLILRDDMNCEIMFMVNTISGNEIVFEDEHYPVKIQKSMPTSITGFRDNGAVIFTLNSHAVVNNSGWQSKLDLTFKAPYRTNEKEAPVTTHYKVEREGAAEPAQIYSVEGGVDVDLQKIETSADGIYTVTFWAEDAAGNRTSDYATKYQVDGTAPQNVQLLVDANDILTGAKEILNNLTFGLFYGKYITLTVVADFNVSGRQKIEYKRVPVKTEAQLEELKNLSDFSGVDWTDSSIFGQAGDWTLVTNSNGVFYDEKEFVGLYFLRLTDRAGNVTTVASNGVVIDLTTPDIQELTVYSSKTYPTEVQVSAGDENWYEDGSYRQSEEAMDPNKWYRSARVEYTTKDAVAGIREIQIWHVYADGKRNAELKQTIPAEQIETDFAGLHNQTYSGTYVTSESDIYRVEVRVIDRAGHSYSSYTDLLHIENRIPTLNVAKPNFAEKESVSGIRVGKWTNKDVTFTLDCIGVGNAPVTYWYQVNGGEWKQIQADNEEFNVLICEDTNAIYRFKALVGGSVVDGAQLDAEATYVVYEGEYKVNMLPTDYQVRVQKTMPEDFDDADIELYYFDDQEKTAQAELDSHAQDNWYNRQLSLKVTLPQPKESSHAPHAYRVHADP